MYNSIKSLYNEIKKLENRKEKNIKRKTSIDEENNLINAELKELVLLKDQYEKFESKTNEFFKKKNSETKNTQI